VPPSRSARERGQAARGQNAVPARAVLIAEQDRLAADADAGGCARGLDLHQRDQGMHLGLCGR